MSARLATCASMIFSLFVVADVNADIVFWDISEVYSNADGSVQFIEFSHATFHGDAHLLTGAKVRTSTGGAASEFVFPSDLSGTVTAGSHMLLATPGFESLPGGVVPDYTIPAGFLPKFFDPASDTIRFGTGNFDTHDSVSFDSSNMPTDGVQSLNFPGGALTNSPTNFAGDAGSVPEPSSVILWAIGVFGLLSPRRMVRVA